MTLAQSRPAVEAAPTGSVRDVLRGNWLVFLTVVSIPISYVPYELGIPQFPTSYPLFALIVLTGARCGVMFNRFGLVDKVALALGVWIVIDSVVYGVGAIPGTADLLLRELLALFAGLVLFRVAQQYERKRAVIYGLRVAVVLCGSWALYQYVVGLPYLLALGYGEGFYFAQAGGAYRPFSTFISPTVFGGFFAMFGIAVIATVARTWVFAVTTLAVASILFLTETRSAIIGLGVALLIVVFRGGRSTGMRIAAVLTVVTYSLLGYQFWQPPFISSALARLSTAGKTGDTSTETRTKLWEGIVEALGHRDAWHSGFLNQEFYSTISPYSGIVITRLGHAHSNYMQELYRYGIPGLLLLIGLLLAFGFVIRQSRRRVPVIVNTAALAGVVVFAIDSVFNNSMSSLNVFTGLMLIAGLGCAPTAEREPTK